MARPPRPTALKLIAGEKKKSRLNDDEPMPQDGVPACPSTDPRVLEVWDYTVKQLLTMRVLTMADRDVLHAYCEAVAAHQAASEILAQEGTFIKLPGGMSPSVPHPAMRQQKDAAAMIKTLGGEFGLSPAARTRIKVKDQQPEKTQSAARLLSS